MSLELEQREGVQRGGQHRDPQEGLTEPGQGGAAHHSEVQHAAAEQSQFGINMYIV